MPDRDWKWEEMDALEAEAKSLCVDDIRAVAKALWPDRSLTYYRTGVLLKWVIKMIDVGTAHRVQDAINDLK